MIPHDQAPEHEFEAEPGLPQALPRDERVLWRGSPDARTLARQAMHTRGLSAYFAILLAWRFTTVLTNGGGALDAAIAVLWLLPLAALAIAALTTMGWLISRTTVYTVTDKRVVMRIGVVLSITFNLPFSQIESAAVRLNADGTGDVTLALNDTAHIAYVHLWPHARPWHVRRTEPMLRALPDARLVTDQLAAALAESVADSEDCEVTLRPRIVPMAPANLPAGANQPDPQRDSHRDRPQQALTA